MIEIFTRIFSSSSFFISIGKNRRTFLERDREREKRVELVIRRSAVLRRSQLRN